MKAEILLMLAIFGGPTEPSDDDYHEVVNGKTLREVLIKQLNRLAEHRRFRAPKFAGRISDLMMYRFGFNGPSKTLKELAEIFGVTRERIRQNEGQALRRLRQREYSQYLKPFIKEGR